MVSAGCVWLAGGFMVSDYGLWIDGFGLMALDCCGLDELGSTGL
jgi:hypothetical protein